MAKVTTLDDEHHILRYVPWQRLRKDEDNNVIGFNPQAFELRVKDGVREEYLSAAWVEFHRADSLGENVRQTVAAFAGNMTVKASTRFALGNVGRVREVCAAHKQKVRISHEPVPGFDAHASVRQFNSDDQNLLELLAMEAWAEMVAPP